MSDYYNCMNDELMHYGIKGMKWGVRRSDADRARYGHAKREVKRARKEYRKDARKIGFGFGLEGIRKAEKSQARLNQAETKFVTEKARYKAAGSKNPNKAEFKTYKRAMYRTGLPGSARDTELGNRGRALYDEIKQRKGKKYADQVAKKVQNQAVATLATSSVVAIGGAFVTAYLYGR